MVVRVKGAIRQGVWFSADVRFVQLTVDTTTFLTDLVADETEAQQLAGVNSILEQVVEVFSTRATVIGLSVETASIVQLMVDYGQAIDPLAGVTLGGQVAQDMDVEFDAQIIGITDGVQTVTTSVIVVEQGFVADALGTPA